MGNDERVIKFNAWDEKGKRMILWEDIEAIERDRIWLRGTKGFVPFVKLLQFTGVLDKEGKEIYDGDIVTNYNGDIQVVEYIGCEWHAKLTKRKTGHWPAQYIRCEHMDWVKIGNIYQDKEKI